MTELQTILKETLARWEADTQRRFTKNEKYIANLKAQVQHIQDKLAAQTQQYEHWQRLETLCVQLEPLLRQWNGESGNAPRR